VNNITFTGNLECKPQKISHVGSQLGFLASGAVKEFWALKL
jgi:hypothetical protein